MKILGFDRKTGVMKLRIENPDDLWHLEKVLEPGDIVRARTFRKLSIKRGQEIREGERESVTLSITLEKKDYHRDTRTLRLTGPITEGPEDKVSLGSYHTISIGENAVLSVRKREWKRYHIERLEKAKTKPPKLLICVLDRDEADFAELRESGASRLATIRSRKNESGEIQGYREEILKYIESIHDRYDTILIAGPGFEKENLERLIKERNPGLAGKIFTSSCHSTGIAGINEVVKTSANSVLRSSRIALETALVEELLSRIGSGKPVAYGRKETEEAAKLGAVETLLVSEENVPEFEEIMDLAEKTGASVRIISSDHEAGERFLRLGGIGALLRFRVSD